MADATVPLSTIPQALESGLASRLRFGQTSLFISTLPTIRGHKRAAANVINYAEMEDDLDEGENYEDDEQSSGYNSRSGSVEPMEGPLTSGPARSTRSGRSVSAGPGASVGPDIVGRATSTGAGGNSHASHHNNLRTVVPELEKSEIKRPAPRAKHMTYTPQQMQDLADKEEYLLPIRLSMDYDDFHISDFLMWNLHEEVLTPDSFAMLTCSELDIPVGYSNLIANSIKHQIQEHKVLAFIGMPPDAALHVIIKLNVTVGSQLFEDQFEWDIGADDVSPEEFARVVVQDLGLSGEFYPAIAHAIHDTILQLKKEMLVEGQLLPREIDNMAAFGNKAGWRVDQQYLGLEWSPTVETLSQEELEKREIERERSSRRLKRESARISGGAVDLYDLGRSRRRRRTYDDSPAGSPGAWN